MKTVRFKQIVAACGRPEVYVSWCKPDSDPQLMKALKQHRVMTLHQTLRGSAKDFGTVGLLVDAHAQILIFPRSLKKFSELRVIGIDYDSLAGAPANTTRRHAKSIINKHRGTVRTGADFNDAPQPLAPTPESPKFEPKPQPPAPPPIAWREITRDFSRIKTAFKHRDYEKASHIFQALADALRPEAE